MLSFLLIGCLTEDGRPVGVDGKTSEREDLCNGFDDDGDGQTDEDAVVFDVWDYNGFSDDLFDPSFPESPILQPRHLDRFLDQGFIFPAGDKDHVFFAIDDEPYPVDLQLHAYLLGPPGTKMAVIRYNGSVEEVKVEATVVLENAATGNAKATLTYDLETIFEDDSGYYAVQVTAPEPSCNRPFTLYAEFNDQAAFPF